MCGIRLSLEGIKRDWFFEFVHSTTFVITYDRALKKLNRYLRENQKCHE